jgi:hypothetical protein
MTVNDHPCLVSGRCLSFAFGHGSPHILLKPMMYKRRLQCRVRASSISKDVAQISGLVSFYSGGITSFTGQ